MITTRANILCCGTAYKAVRAGLGARVDLGAGLGTPLAASADLRAPLRADLSRYQPSVVSATLPAQMKKARRIRQAFIKFGCGGRI